MRSFIIANISNQEELNRLLDDILKYRNYKVNLSIGKLKEPVSVLIIATDMSTWSAFFLTFYIKKIHFLNAKQLGLDIFPMVGTVKSILCDNNHIILI